MHSVSSISPLLKASVKTQKAGTAAPNWRVHKKNFLFRTKEPGAVTFSSGWFAQGHEVCNNV